MIGELKQLERYLDQTIGAKVTPTPWRGSKRVAPFLGGLYNFREIRILDTPCLLMVDIGRQEQSAAVIRKHITLVQAKWSGEIIYVRDHLTAYNRKRLVEQRVAFMVPGNQMYLPMLGIDFREHFKRLRTIPVIFSPSTQALVIHWLLRGTGEEMTPAQMSQQLGCSPMTMTRAFDELEAAELGKIWRQGRERRLCFGEPKRDVWAKIQRFLRSPVAKRLYIRQPRPLPEGVRAGLAALAQYSMLAAPAHPVIALPGLEWTAMKQRYDVTAIPVQDPDVLEVEVWSYDPGPLADQGAVDPLSLYLSLKDNNDERVEAALERMLGSLKW